MNIIENQHHQKNLEQRRNMNLKSLLHNMLIYIRIQLAYYLGIKEEHIISQALFPNNEEV